MLFDELTEVIDPEPHGAAMNMAIDEVLLRGATEPLLRVYRWACPAISFGCFVRHAEVRAQWPERELVRRWTGGGIVPHGDDVTYTIVAPSGAALCTMDLLSSYQAVHERIAQLLGEATLVHASAAKVSEACFENAARHDVLLGGRKVAGAAQRRTSHGLLHQGSIQHANAANAVRGRLARAFSGQVRQRSLTEDELYAAGKLAAEKYASVEWMHRL